MFTCVSKIKASRLFSDFSLSCLARSLFVKSCSLETHTDSFLVIYIENSITGMKRKKKSVPYFFLEAVTSSVEGLRMSLMSSSTVMSSEILLFF